jgi:hypothetical protein
MLDISIPKIVVDATSQSPSKVSSTCRPITCVIAHLSLHRGDGYCCASINSDLEQQDARFWMPRAMSAKLGSSSLGPIKSMDDLPDDLLGVNVIADGWREGVGCGRGESELCVVLCGTSRCHTWQVSIMNIHHSTNISKRLQILTYCTFA